MLTTTTIMFLVMFVLNGLAVTLLFTKTRCFRGAKDRYIRIAAWILPLIAIGIEAFYHSLTELGFSIPRGVHDIVPVFLFVGMYFLTKSESGGWRRDKTIGERPVSNVDTDSAASHEVGSNGGKEAEAPSEPSSGSVRG